MHVLYEITFWVLWLLVLCSCGFYLTSWIAALDFFRFSRKEAARPKTFTPPVSILKPVRGVDAHAYECWVSFCNQDYPEFEMIFGVREATDPAIGVIRQLQQDFPHRSIKLVINPTLIGISAKVSNLYNIFPEAQHDILVVSDSDILVEPDYLKTVVAPMENPRMGVVTCMYRGIGGTNFSAVMETIGITGEFMLGVLVARKTEGMKFAMGSTIVTRKEVMARYGGFLAIADNLADDYLMGYLAAEAGYEVTLSPCIVEHILPDYGFSDFMNHQLRWARGTKFSRPAGYLGLLLTHTTVLSLLLVLLFPFSRLGWGTAALGLLLRLGAAWYIGVSGMKDFRLKRYFHLLPIRDCLSFVIWIVSFTGDTIHWRGDKFRIVAGGKLVPYQDNR